MLSAAELTSMRTTLNRSLPGTAIIKNGALVSDGGGGATETFTARGTVSCRIAPVNRAGEEVTEGGRISPDADWIITLPALTTIERDDQVDIGGTVYAVVATRAPRSYEISRRVEAREVV